MGRLRRKRAHHARRDVSRAARTRARKLDQDQIHDNLTDPSKRDELENPSELDPDKPGLGAYYCIACDRHFPSDNDKEKHLSSKLHKRKAKRAQEDPYTPEEAYRAAGIGVDNKQKDVKQKSADGTEQQMKGVEA